VRERVHSGGVDRHERVGEVGEADAPGLGGDAEGGGVSGSGDGEREASMTRQMPYGPLPASVLFAPLFAPLLAHLVASMLVQYSWVSPFRRTLIMPEKIAVPASKTSSPFLNMVVSPVNNPAVINFPKAALFP
jgi:hypothetical protein